MNIEFCSRFFCRILELECFCDTWFLVQNAYSWCSVKRGFVQDFQTVLSLFSVLNALFLAVDTNILEVEQLRSLDWQPSVQMLGIWKSDILTIKTVVELSVMLPMPWVTLLRSTQWLAAGRGTDGYQVTCIQLAAATYTMVKHWARAAVRRAGLAVKPLVLYNKWYKLFTVTRTTS